MAPPLDWLPKELLARLDDFFAAGHRSMFVKDLSSGRVLYQAQEKVVRPAASLLKVAIALALYDAAENGLLDLEAESPIGSLGGSRYPSLLKVFREHHAFTVRELCGIMLATSDNIASNYVLELVGFDVIEETLQALGADSTSLVAGFRDDEFGDLGRQNVTTAADMAGIFEVLWREPRYQTVLYAMENGLRKERLALRLPEDLQIVNKTGSLDSVCNDVAIFHDEDLTLVVAFLSDLEADTAATALRVGDLAGTVWKTLGGRMDEQQG
jgi:beta-lactamase class A